MTQTKPRSDDAAFKGWPACDVCGKPITDLRLACLSLDTERAREGLLKYDRLLRAGQQADGSILLADMPDLTTHSVSWLWAHSNCVPQEQSYWIDGDRFDTMGKVLSWTMHVADKLWFDSLTWESAVRRFWMIPSA